MSTVMSPIPKAVCTALMSANTDNHRLRDALWGWLYMATVDRPFLLPQSMSATANTNQTPKVQHTKLSDEHTVTAQLRSIFSDPRPRAVYDRLTQLAQQPSCGVHGDSFLSGSGGLSDRVADKMRNAPLRVVVIGAGCAGLSTAYALKQTFEASASVLVVENRVVRPHVKQPYTRD